MPHYEFIKQLIGGPSDFGVGWMIILVSSIITILVSVSSFLKWLINKAQKKKRLLETISLLDTGAHMSHLNTLLGNPVSINRVGHFQEYIFVNHYFYIQALADSNSNVILFSVTTRKKTFCPTLRDQFGSFLVKLGKTNFSHLSNPKDTITSGDHGAITFYSESYYFGLDGGYRTYAFSFNPSGYGKLPEVPLSLLRSDTPQDPDAIKTFREKRALVNRWVKRN